MQSRWEVKYFSEHEKQLSKQLADELNISYISATMLVRRGLTDAQKARDFVSPKLENLYNPFLMKDMDKAVDRINSAINNKERILIYGDYDVDGTTAVALVYKYLSRLYKDIDYYIPDRYTEGYGISYKGIDYACQTNCRLIIALDCGIRSIDKVEYAKSKGIDFIICDHHLPGNKIPDAVAVLDAKREDNTYPFRELCGCGVGFKLMQALAQKNQLPFSSLTYLLELCAMSIASDIVPITDENRILAYYGIRQLNISPSVGVNSLIEKSGIEKGKLNIDDLVFRIGPRINACGRIKTGRSAVELLITEDIEKADNMANEVDENNSTRKNFDQQITNKALEILESDPDNNTKKITIVKGENWHRGVVGIVASRLTETYFRPTIVLSEQDGILTGSARSVGGFDIYSAIDSCSDLLTNFGGHIYAAGLSMKLENYDEFCRRMEEYTSKHILPEQQEPIIDIEAEISFADITAQFFNILRHLEPFGPGNPRPIFLTRGVCNYRYTRRVGKQLEHLKLDLMDKRAALSGIAFGKAELASDLLNGKNADVCYTLNQNTFNGVTSIQMMAQDIRICN